MECMIEMSGPEAPRTPRFNDLSLAIVKGIIRAKGWKGVTTEDTKHTEIRSTI
jgi:hypothetical protein